MSVVSLILIKGLPGSGKSTLAKALVAESNGTVVRVNRDDLRMMTFGKYVLDNPREQEPLITKMQEAMVRATLRAGISVIVDDTNGNAHFREAWVRLAEQCKAKYVLHEMDTPIEECIRRDQERWERDGERLVGRAIIERMAENAT
jgi:predicted kinase